MCFLALARRALCIGVVSTGVACGSTTDVPGSGGDASASADGAATDATAHEATTSDGATADAFDAASDGAADASSCTQASCGTNACGRSDCGLLCGMCPAPAIGCFVGKCSDVCPGTPCVDVSGEKVCEGGSGARACSTGPKGYQVCVCSGGGPMAWMSCGPCL